MASSRVELYSTSYLHVIMTEVLNLSIYLPLVHFNHHACILTQPYLPGISSNLPAVPIDMNSQYTDSKYFLRKYIPNYIVSYPRRQLSSYSPP
jgi:hypothetical protein